MYSATRLRLTLRLYQPSQMCMKANNARIEGFDLKLSILVGKLQGHKMRNLLLMVLPNRVNARLRCLLMAQLYVRNLCHRQSELRHLIRYVIRPHSHAIEQRVVSTT